MNRLALLAAAAALIPMGAALAQHTGHGKPAAADPIAAAVAAPTRTPANVARDRYRHPVQTLAFFGVKPGSRVVEYSPSGGWYTEILAPLLRDKGTFYALQPTGSYLPKYREFLAAKPIYDKVQVVAYPEEAAEIPANSIDTVLTFRNVHNMVMGGKEAETFKAFYTMLKPGGTLGVVDHRLPESRDTALEKTSGYLKVSTIRRIAQAAGFEYVGSSEVNANPKDTADWAKGVWTLPPTLSLKDVDREKYLAIGESDRMTLKFRKPMK